MSGRRVCTSWRMKYAAVLAILAVTICPDVSIGIGTPVSGYSGWTYLDSGGSTWYFYNDYGRFSFDNSVGKWYGYDKFGKHWNTLSGTGASGNYLFDGAYHDLRNGWTYLYSNSLQTGNWARNGVARFGYNYNEGRWYESDTYGATWQRLSAPCRSSSFIGNGIKQDLGNGWAFVYGYTADTGNWARSDTGAARFAYNYTSGRWSEYDPYGVTWRTLSSTGRSAYFVGNGTLSDLGNGWKYVYGYSGDSGNWARSDTGAARFAYNYNSGQWWFYGFGWNRLGATGTTAAFMGDGAWRTVSSAWAFSYDNPGDAGTWRRQVDGSERFRYSGGMWLTTSPYNGGIWNYIEPLPTGPYSSAFMGDGAWHAAGSNWSYAYDVSTDFAHVKFQGNLQFAYNYGLGQWSHYDRIFSTWRDLGAAGQSNFFIGDGLPHDIGFVDGSGAPLMYSFFTSTGAASWTGQVGFLYWYSTGQWSFSAGGPYWELGNSNLSAVFMGDGAQHDLNNGWLFAYQDSMGKFYRNVDETPLRFSVSPATGGWSHYDGANSSQMTGFINDIGLSWLSDGQMHYNGSWLFSYNYASDELGFYAKASGTPSYDNPVLFLKYSYADHRWHDRRAISSASWYLIPTDGIGSEIERNYWTDTHYNIGSGKLLGILASYATPGQGVRNDAQPGYLWAYWYGDGTWRRWDGTTWITLATDADPNLYR